MTHKLIKQILLFSAAALALFPVIAFADFTPICGTSVTADQVVEVDDKNLKLVLFGQAQIVSKQAAPGYLLKSYLSNKEAAANFGPDKWKSVFDNCLKAKDAKLAAMAFLLYAGSAEAKNTPPDNDYIESVFLGEDNSEVSQEISQLNDFESLTQELKYIIFISIGMKDVHWLRVNLLGKTFYLSEEFKKYSEQKLTSALKVKKVKAAKEIAAMLEALFVANAEKYKKYYVACNLIEDLLENESDLTSSQLLTLVSIRNTDTSMRPVIDPFLIEGFQSLASDTVEKGKYDEALSQISTINADQATPTTYAIIKKIIAAIDPASKVLLNDTVNELLLSAARNDTEFNGQLIKFYFTRIQKLLGLFDISSAQRTFDRFQTMSNDPAMLDDLKLEFALKYLQTGNREAANKIVATFSPSLGEKLKLFIDGYYGNPLFYVLFLLVPLIIKLSYEFFNKVSYVPPAEEETNQEHYRMSPPEQQAGSPENDVSQFVSANRSIKQKNQLVEEYKDCLSVFELKKGVDLKTIKTAYRNAVRKIHPDLNADNQSPDDASRFVELTKTYDRLRELHRLLGFETK